MSDRPNASEPDAEPDKAAASTTTTTRSGRFDSARVRARARREELRQQDTLDLMLPSYGGEFAVRYRAVDDDEFDKLVKRIQSRGNTESNLGTALDLLSRCCEVVLVRVGDEMEPLLDDEDQPIGYDDRLADFFNLSAAERGAVEGEGSRVRDIIKAVFSPDGTRPLAPGVHAMAVVDWMQGQDAKIDQALLGE